MNERARSFQDCRDCHLQGRHSEVEGCVLYTPPNPRKDPQTAFETFMAMSDDEWSLLVRELLLEGGVLEPAESEGFERAYNERRAL